MAVQVRPGLLGHRRQQAPTVEVHDLCTKDWESSQEQIYENESSKVAPGLLGQHPLRPKSSAWFKKMKHSESNSGISVKSKYQRSPRMANLLPSYLLLDMKNHRRRNRRLAIHKTGQSEDIPLFE